MRRRGHRRRQGGAGGCRRGERGQALIETLLVTMPLIMILAAVLQVFLIDDAFFRVMTQGHHRLLTRALARNDPAFDYEQLRVNLDDRARNVPVVPLFRPMGLTRESLRIRSHVYPYGPKQLSIGAGTRASCLAVGLPPCP